MAATTTQDSSTPAKKHRHPQTHSEKLEDQAATAALYATKKDDSSKTGQEYLENKKLSGAGAAASLKYAHPQDLPSFPVVGVKKDSAAAGTAATLGWKNQKSPEVWKPDASPAAATAAMLAKDYKLDPAWKPDVGSHGLTAAKLAHSGNSKVEIWQPSASANGAKAALLAHKDHKGVEVWKPAVNDWGNSAANLAFKKQAGSTQGATSNTAIGRHHSNLAAHGAVNNRRRADSTPAPPARETYPDEHNASANALKAAASAAGKKRASNMPKGGASSITALSAAMYTSHPQIGPQYEDEKHDSMLQASAIAMAKSMYNRQERARGQNEAAAAGASSAHNRNRDSMSTLGDTGLPRFTNLQEAAEKLAHERLAKLHDDNMQQREYREYYGSQNATPGRRLTLRGRQRRRASSLDADRAQSDRIRAQMSLFSSNLSTIDDKKRKTDREALLAAAQRNVNKQMHGMDEQVFADTGRVAPSLLEDWELKAHNAAKAKSDARMKNHGKVNIGGGMFIDQAEVDAVAARKVQPVIDDINEKAEVNREKQAAVKAEQEKHANTVAAAKARDREHKAINKRLAQQDKDEEKARKHEEKERKHEEKRLVKEKRKSGGVVATPAPVVAAPVPVETTVTQTETIVPATEEQQAPVAPPVTEPQTQPATTTASTSSSEPAAVRTSMEDAASLRMRENAAAAAVATGEPSPLAPNVTAAEGGRVKSWLKKQFSKRSSKPPGSFDTGRDGKEDAVVREDEEEEEVADAPASSAPAATAATAVVVPVIPVTEFREASEVEQPIGHVTTRGAESEHHIITESTPRSPLQRQATHVSSDSELSDDAHDNEDVHEEAQRGRTGKKRSGGGGGFLSKLGVGSSGKAAERSVSPVSVSPVSDTATGKGVANDSVMTTGDATAVDHGLEPPPRLTGGRTEKKGKGSPASGSRFRESLEEL